MAPYFIHADDAIELTAAGNTQTGLRVIGIC